MKPSTTTMQELCPKPGANTAGDLKETMDYYANKCAEYRAERDALKARERELVEALEEIAEVCNGYGDEAGWACNKARSVLAKVRL